MLARPVHLVGLITAVRDKTNEKFPGAAPIWLQDLVTATGMRFYCAKCQLNSVTMK